MTDLDAEEAGALATNIAGLWIAARRLAACTPADIEATVEPVWSTPALALRSVALDEGAIAADDEQPGDDPHAAVLAALVLLARVDLRGLLRHRDVKPATRRLARTAQPLHRQLGPLLDAYRQANADGDVPAS